jgi:N-methylhydantoinase A
MSLAPGSRVKGPALIVEEVSTTWLADGWDCRVDERGNLMLERSSEGGTPDPA